MKTGGFSLFSEHPETGRKPFTGSVIRNVKQEPHLIALPEVGVDYDGFVSWPLGTYGMGKNKEQGLQWQDMGLSRVPWRGCPEGQIQR